MIVLLSTEVLHSIALLEHFCTRWLPGKLRSGGLLCAVQILSITPRQVRTSWLVQLRCLTSASTCIRKDVQQDVHIQCLTLIVHNKLRSPIRKRETQRQATHGALPNGEKFPTPQGVAIVWAQGDSGDTKYVKMYSHEQGPESPHFGRNLQALQD